MIKLDIGCGEEEISNAIRVDIRKTDIVDVIADARFLPFKDATFDYVYSSHLIEHFSHRDVKSVLLEWIRVLKKGGTIEIRCPYLRIRALIFFLNPSWQNMKNIYGEQDHAFNYHKAGFSYGLLKHILKDCGITNIKRVIRGYKGIPFMPDCLHVQGVKK